ncbi:MAG: flagellar basal-body MS-ring/collar protein FliF [Bacillota bacterium]
MARSTVVARITERWQAFTPPQKVAVVVAAAGLIFAAIYLPILATSLNYAPLFTGLRPEEAGAIVQKLKDAKIPYRLANEGTTIEVPKDRVYETRIQLASAGAIGAGGPGFELFDRTRLGVTEFEQQVNYQRALQGELERTIMQLDGVEQARVHLVLPRQDVFAEEQAEPTASVVVKLKPLTQLKQEQVNGIVNLVAGSVEGLKPENVHVIDMYGRDLTGTGGKDVAGAQALTQQEARRAYERELERRVQGMLERVLGPGKAVAMVSAELDFSRQETVTTVPEGQQVLSEQTINEQGTGTGAAGQAGTPGNLQTYQTPTGGQQTYNRQETTRNYQVGTRQETTVAPPGRLKRLSTAVLVDGNLTAARTEQIRNIVAAALGFDPARGDQITVSSMAFDTTYQKELEKQAREAEAAARKEQAKRLLTYMIAGGAALLLFLVGSLVVLARRRRRPAPTVEEVVPVAVTAERPPVPPVADKEKAARELARERPDQVAEIIKVWLREEQRG